MRSTSQITHNPHNRSRNSLILLRFGIDEAFATEDQHSSTGVKVGTRVTKLHMLDSFEGPVHIRQTSCAQNVRVGGQSSPIIAYRVGVGINIPSSTRVNKGVVFDIRRDSSHPTGVGEDGNNEPVAERKKNSENAQKCHRPNEPRCCTPAWTHDETVAQLAREIAARRCRSFVSCCVVDQHPLRIEQVPVPGVQTDMVRQQPPSRSTQQEHSASNNPPKTKGNKPEIAKSLFFGPRTSWSRNQLKAPHQPPAVQSTKQSSR